MVVNANVSTLRRSNQEIIDYSSNDLSFWIQKFHDLSDLHGVFDNILSIPGYSSSISASVVGNAWLEFSEFMPWFLCQASAQVTTNTKRAYICKIANEELGLGIPSEVHSELFLQCLNLANVPRNIRTYVPTDVLRNGL